MLGFLVSSVGACGRCTTCSDEERITDELQFNESSVEGEIGDRPFLSSLQHMSAVSGPPPDYDEYEGSGGLISARSAASETRAEMIRRLRAEAEERDRVLRESRPRSSVNQAVPMLALTQIPKYYPDDPEYYAADDDAAFDYCATPCSSSPNCSPVAARPFCEDVNVMDAPSEARPAGCEKVHGKLDSPLSAQTTADYGSEKPTFRSQDFAPAKSASTFDSSERPANRGAPGKPTLLGSQNADGSFAKELLVQRQAQALERAAQTRRHHKLRSFLVSGGFREGVNSRKPSRKNMLSWGFSYPLHAAVKANDADAIEVLLWAGADRSLPDSEGLTPLALAQRLDKQDSHRKVLICLSS